MADNVGNLRVVMTIDNKGVVKGIAEVEKSSEKMGKTVAESGRKSEAAMSKVKVAAAAAAVAFAAAGAGLFVLTRKATEYVKVASVQEAAEARLAAVLRSTGHAAGYNIDQLRELSTRLQNTTAFGDELTLSAMAMLATFTNIRKEAFERTITAAMDLATVMGRDLQSEVLALGRAINDPVESMELLNRKGIRFSEQQREMIHTLWMSGDALGAQNIILTEVERRVSGAAEAYRKTFMGAVRGAEDSLGDLKEEIGFLITKNESLIQIVGEVEQAFEDWAVVIRNHAPEIKQHITGIAREILAWGRNIMEAEGLWNKFRAALEMPEPEGFLRISERIVKIREEMERLQRLQFVWHDFVHMLTPAALGHEIIRRTEELKALRVELEHLEEKRRALVAEEPVHMIRGRVVWPGAEEPPPPPPDGALEAMRAEYRRMTEEWRLAQMTQTQIALEELGKRRDAFLRVAEDNLAVERWYHAEVAKILAADPVIAERLKGLEEEERVRKDAIEQFRQLKMTETERELASLHQQYLHLKQHVEDKVALEIYYQQTRAGIIAAAEAEEEARRLMALERQRAEQEARFAQEHQVLEELRSSWWLTWEEIRTGGVNAWTEIGHVVTSMSYKMSSALVGVVTGVKDLRTAVGELLMSYATMVVEAMMRIGVQQLILGAIGRTAIAGSAAATAAAMSAALPATAAQAKALALATAGVSATAGAAAYTGAKASMMLADAAARAAAPLMDRGGITAAGGLYRTGNIREAHIPLPAGQRIPVEVKEASPAPSQYFTVNIQAMDVQSFRDYMLQNRDGLADVMMNAIAHNHAARRM